jgi:hypothetical protein
LNNVDFFYGERMGFHMSLRSLLTGAALAASISVAALLVGCSTAPVAPTSDNAALVAGRVKLNIGGSGTGHFGAEGWINAIYTWGVTVVLRDDLSGTTYEATTRYPDGQFMIPNVAPGGYTIRKLWCQVQTMNAWVTVSTNLEMPETFQVVPHGIADLGSITWDFRYDLTDPTSTSAIAFVPEFASVRDDVLRSVANTPWSALDITEIQLNGEGSRVTSTVSSLPPRGPGGHVKLLP